MKFDEINIQEFEKEIYPKYITLFPKEEQRNWDKIKKTYEKGQEKFYKIVEKEEIIGFFMLEKCSEKHPYYIDYFAIFEEYQNKGYGTKTIKKIIKEIAKKDGVCIEIEKEDENVPKTLKRAKFYESLGFQKVDSEYLLYNVYFIPYMYMPNGIIEKEQADKIMFDYYLMNCGEQEVKERCRIIK